MRTDSWIGIACADIAVAVPGHLVEAAAKASPGDDSRRPMPGPRGSMYRLRSAGQAELERRGVIPTVCSGMIVRIWTARR